MVICNFAVSTVLVMRVTHSPIIIKPTGHFETLTITQRSQTTFVWWQICNVLNQVLVCIFKFRCFTFLKFFIFVQSREMLGTLFLASADHVIRNVWRLVLICFVQTGLEINKNMTTGSTCENTAHVKHIFVAALFHISFFSFIKMTPSHKDPKHLFEYSKSDPRIRPTNQVQ